MNKLSALLVSALLSLASFSATAGTITFTGLGNFGNHSEAGMNMTSSSVWNWPGANMAHMDSGVATFKLASAGNFTLNNFELLANGGGGVAHVEAFNNNAFVGFVDFSGAGVFNFSSIFSGIDEFRISVPGGHFTFDNINFDERAVPEPSSIALFGLALAGMGAFSRRRASKAK